MGDLTLWRDDRRNNTHNKPLQEVFKLIEDKNIGNNKPDWMVKRNHVN